MLSIHNLSASIENKKILDGISFNFVPGKVYAIMGPNGSGKSTLAGALMGNPQTKILRGSKILLNGKNVTNLSPEKRAKLGIFLSFQSPLALPGVSVKDLLRIALEKKMDPMTIHKTVKAYAAELHIKDELLQRSLNDGFSGGEKKKLEALQAAILTPTVAIFDELDTGVDVDALRTISTFLKKKLPKDSILIFITHSTRLLSSIKPHEVLIIRDGRLVKTGKGALAKKIEEHGFTAIK
ncbi:MAG: Fe-S cluster assembly ATPase SufC [Patescibacteria group bacterium]